MGSSKTFLTNIYWRYLLIKKAGGVAPCLFICLFIYLPLLLFIEATPLLHPRPNLTLIVLKPACLALSTRDPTSMNPSSLINLLTYLIFCHLMLQ